MRILLSTGVLGLILACGGAEAPSSAAVAPTQLARTDVEVVTRAPIAAGPRVSGTLEASKIAVIRAEAAGSVEVVAVEIGQRVQKGELLARIEAVVARETQISASAGLIAAEQDVKMAERELQRVTQLVAVGALAQRDQEMTESALIAARARLKDARARAAGANEQLSGATVRAPLDGVVSQRSVSQGDIVAPGAPLFTVLDPSSLRLTGSVPADALSVLRPGASVELTIQGHPGRRFAGSLERVSPAVDTITRQIPILVTLPNDTGELIAGLFAEGRVAAESHEGLLVPSDALLGDASGAAVLRLAAGVVERREVTIGLRDEAAERVEILTGVDAGDVVLLGPARQLVPGTPAVVQDAAVAGG